ncbi:Structural maintenance of chromosomes protein 6 [Aspergillus hancockii]|nr:Structural maintenance of chromosomes protein 6 [Aspergillus hancockii]
MSSLKRPQGLLEPEEWDGENDRTGLSSSSHKSKRKRLRTSGSPTSYEDTESDQESGGRSRRSITRAWEFDEDELELRATQLIQEKYSFSSDEPNVPAEHGILERVECYNFMCHDHFNVELGPLINFIVGKNGSGKSAVLTAIILCLGGKASATNRGQSLKSFIKEGKESATIVVRIKNQGDGAYMPDDYGKSIIVERHFSKNGASGFKLKAENGRIVSTKKAELDGIIDFFTLQFDNPMNVLSQDMARQFLSSSSPAEKYKFFVKGVQLEQLDQDYRLIEESADQIEEKLRGREQDIEILKHRRDAAQQKLDISDQHESLRNRLRNVRSQMAWAQVEEQEKIIKSLEIELTRADEKIAIAEAQLGSFDSDIREAESETRAAAEYVTQATAKLEQAQSEKEEIKVNRSKAEQRQIREYLKAAEARINETQRAIAEENQRLADQGGVSYARRQEELERARVEATDARTRHEEHQRDADRLYRELEDAENEAAQLEAPIGRTKADVEQAETLLRTLNKGGGSRNSGFHDKLPALLRAVEQERSFTERPVGPIGHHVILLKPEWSSILENSLGATLNSFIVTSKKDMNLLSNIMHKVNCVCPIFIGSGGYIDTSGHEPDPRFDTALRVLQIDNELVRRQLIINHGIEQMLLIERLEEASSVLFDGQKPKNVKRLQRKEDHVEELADALDREPAGADHLDVLLATLQEAVEEKRLNEGQLKDSTEAMDTMMRTLKGIKQEMASKDAEIAAFNEELRILIETLKHRKKRWEIFRSHISSRAKAQFTYLLSERSFRGRLLTDHEGKLLDLQVEPDITKDSTGRGAKTLSGGEKSFSQVCLLLALWEAMGSPIRCLDEFDVYMDHINRKMAIDMLMLAARRSVGVQFILITPGSRAEISLAPDVRVKELAEPERGQTRLSFRQ